MAGLPIGRLCPEFLSRVHRSNWTAGLTAGQVAAVVTVFWFTLTGAIVLALVLRRWNARRPVPN